MKLIELKACVAVVVQFMKKREGIIEAETKQPPFGPA